MARCHMLAPPARAPLDGAAKIASQSFTSKGPVGGQTKRPKPRRTLLEFCPSFCLGPVSMANHLFTSYVCNDFLFVLPYAVKYGVQDDVMFLAHHVTLVITWTSFLTGSWGHLFAVPTMLTEVTAPFVFMRWLLNEFKIGGAPFIANGLLLLFAWYFFRIAGYVFFLSIRLFELRGELLDPAMAARNLPVLAFHLLGCFLQLYWGKLLTLGALRTISPAKKKTEKEAS